MKIKFLLLLLTIITLTTIIGIKIANACWQPQSKNCDQCTSPLKAINIDVDKKTCDYICLNDTGGTCPWKQCGLPLKHIGYGMQCPKKDKDVCPKCKADKLHTNDHCLPCGAELHDGSTCGGVLHAYIVGCTKREEKCYLKYELHGSCGFKCTICNKTCGECFIDCDDENCKIGKKHCKEADCAVEGKKCDGCGNIMLQEIGTNKLTDCNGKRTCKSCYTSFACKNGTATCPYINKKCVICPTSLHSSQKIQNKYCDNCEHCTCGAPKKKNETCKNICQTCKYHSTSETCPYASKTCKKCPKLLPHRQKNQICTDENKVCDKCERNMHGLTKCSGLILSCQKHAFWSCTIKNRCSQCKRGGGGGGGGGGTGDNPGDTPGDNSGDTSDDNEYQYAKCDICKEEYEYTKDENNTTPPPCPNTDLKCTCGKSKHRSNLQCEDLYNTCEICDADSHGGCPNENKNCNICGASLHETIKTLGEKCPNEKYCDLCEMNYHNIQDECPNIQFCEICGTDKHQIAICPKTNDECTVCKTNIHNTGLKCEFEDISCDLCKKTIHNGTTKCITTKCDICKKQHSCNEKLCEDIKCDICETAAEEILKECPYFSKNGNPCSQCEKMIKGYRDFQCHFQGFCTICGLKYHNTNKKCENFTCGTNGGNRQYCTECKIWLSENECPNKKICTQCDNLEYHTDVCPNIQECKICFKTYHTKNGICPYNNETCEHRYGKTKSKNGNIIEKIITRVFHDKQCPDKHKSFFCNACKIDVLHTCPNEHEICEVCKNLKKKGETCLNHKYCSTCNETYVNYSPDDNCPYEEHYCATCKENKHFPQNGKCPNDKHCQTCNLDYHNALQQCPNAKNICDFCETKYHGTSCPNDKHCQTCNLDYHNIKGVCPFDNLYCSICDKTYHSKYDVCPNNLICKHSQCGIKYHTKNGKCPNDLICTDIENCGIKYHNLSQRCPGQTDQCQYCKKYFHDSTLDEREHGTRFEDNGIIYAHLIHKELDKKINCTKYIQIAWQIKEIVCKICGIPYSSDMRHCPNTYKYICGLCGHHSQKGNCPNAQYCSICEINYSAQKCPNALYCKICQKDSHKANGFCENATIKCDKCPLMLHNNETCPNSSIICKKCEAIIHNSNMVCTNITTCPTCNAQVHNKNGQCTNKYPCSKCNVEIHNPDMACTNITTCSICNIQVHNQTGRCQNQKYCETCKSEYHTPTGICPNNKKCETCLKHYHGEQCGNIKTCEKCNMEIHNIAGVCENSNKACDICGENIHNIGFICIYTYKQKTCRECGAGMQHADKKCTFYNQTCNQCGYKGHFYKCPYDKGICTVCGTGKIHSLNGICSNGNHEKFQLEKNNYKINNNSDIAFTIPADYNPQNYDIILQYQTNNDSNQYLINSNYSEVVTITNWQFLQGKKAYYFGRAPLKNKTLNDDDTLSVRVKIIPKDNKLNIFYLQPKHFKHNKRKMPR